MKGSPRVHPGIKVQAVETPPLLRVHIGARPDHMVLRHLGWILKKHLPCGNRADSVASVLCADLMV